MHPSSALRRLPSDDLTAVHNKTAITINVYDLLPVDSKLSSVFWFLGVGLLHTGVVINDREYAFGGHDRKGVTGVYWMKPQQNPPGATFRMSIPHGHSHHSPFEIEEILREATLEFLGPTYNVLTRNCNHFTSYMCEKLTGQPSPKWTNRAASIGVALPCVVPQAWIEPPTCEEEVMLPPRGTVGGSSTSGGVGGGSSGTRNGKGGPSSSTANLRSSAADHDDDAWSANDSEVSDSDDDKDSKAIEAGRIQNGHSKKKIGLYSVA